MYILNKIEFKTKNSISCDTCNQISPMEKSGTFMAKSNSLWMCDTDMGSTPKGLHRPLTLLLYIYT